MGTRARKYSYCRLLRHLRPNSSHAITYLGHGRQASRGSWLLRSRMGHRIQGLARLCTIAAPMAVQRLLSKALQTVRRLFRDRASPPTRHRPLFPRGNSSSSRDCIFGVDPSTRQRLCPEDTSAAASPSGYLASVPNVPSDHSGDVLAVLSVPECGEHLPLLAERGPCVVADVVSMDDSSFATKIKIHSRPIAGQLGCVALLNTGSPQTLINTHALKSMKRAGAASAICERHTPSRSRGEFS